MKLVAFARAPHHAEEAAAALAGAAGLALAEARMRLAPEPPGLLARLPGDAADALVATLGGVGVAALAIEEAVPSDADRLVARQFEFAEASATFTPRTGASLGLPWSEVVAIFRGLRASRSSTEHTEKSRKFSMGRALATSGLMMTRTTSKTVQSSQESVEQVILVYPRRGESVLLAEHALDFSCLGDGLQPSSTANMVEVARRLRVRAPDAFYDERLLRLGRRPLPFVTGGEHRLQASGTVTTRTSTRGALDVLAEVLHCAHLEGLLS